MSRVQGAGLVVVLLSLVSLLSKVLGFVREQILAHRFGVSGVTDAFYAAQALPTLLQAVVAGALATALVPLFAQASREGRGAVLRLVQTASVVLGGLFALESLLLWATAGPAIGLLVPGMDPVAQQLSVSLTRIHAVTVFFMGLSAVFTALANANQRYLWPAVAGLGSNVTVLAAAFFWRQDLTIQQLTQAILVGYIGHLLLLLPVMHRAKLPLLGRPELRLVPSLLRLSLPWLIATGIAQATPLLDRYYASYFEAGSLAALNYGLKLSQLPVGVVVMGLSTVIFTRFARLAVDGQLSDLAVALGRSFRWLLFLLAPASLLTVGLARPLVSLAFERGAFGGEATALTASLFAIYALGLLPMAALPILQRAMAALHDLTSPIWTAAAGTLSYGLLLQVFTPAMGVRGIALAFAVSQYLVMGLSLLPLVRRLGWRGMGVTPSWLFNMNAGLLVMGASLWAVSRLPLNGAASLVLSGGVAAVSYLGIALWGRMPEAHHLVALIRNRRVGVKLKRLIDLGVASIGLFLLSPLVLLIALAIWLTMGRPILFCQVRTGRGGQPFTLLKFRSMREVVPGEQPPTAVQPSPAVELALAPPRPPVQRLTGLGRLLRATSLDELPQLLNVLRGELSLVGPRPLLPRYLPYYTERERKRFDVLPGMTGWAQVHGRNRLPWNERLAMDVWYVENQSLWLDLRILVRTLGLLLRPWRVAVDPRTVFASLDVERARRGAARGGDG